MKPLHRVFYWGGGGAIPHGVYWLDVISQATGRLLTVLVA